MDVLHLEYDIPITIELDEEVNEMCNLGEGIEERALEKGQEQGRQSAKEDYAVKWHDKGKSDSEIAELLEITVDKVHDILVQQGAVST